MKVQALVVCAFLGAACSSSRIHQIDFVITELASLERIGGTANGSSFRLRNLTSHSLKYVHWLGGGVEPVAYCKYSDGSIIVCGEEGRPVEELFTHEIAMNARHTVTFEAPNTNAVAVGVLLLINGGGEYLWSEGIAQQRAPGDSQKPRT